MNYHTNYLLNATISLPLLPLLLSPPPLSGAGDAQSQPDGEYGVREDEVGVHRGYTLKLKLPTERKTFRRGYVSPRHLSASCMNPARHEDSRPMEADGGGGGDPAAEQREQYVVNIAHFRYFISGGA